MLGVMFVGLMFVVMAFFYHKVILLQVVLLKGFVCFLPLYGLRLLS